MKSILFTCLVVALSQANAESNTLREKITQSLESLLASQAEAQGVENCENKCDKAFNRLAYQISAADGKRTYEFQACVQGCNQCVTDLANNAPKDNCFRTCKDFDWKAQGIVKGVIEPDKACIGGCVINTCQVICAGGTTDPKQTPANKQFFYNNGGCSIKTQPYSQSLEYVPWNSPNTQQGGSAGVAQCCANALSLCEYVGDTTSTNYAQLLQVTADYCAEDVTSRARDDICNFYSNPQNCGGGLPLPV